MRKAFLFLLSFVLLCVPAFAEDAPAEMIVRCGKAEEMIALSFDDGPHERYTAEILDLLKEHGIHATFFVIGENVRAHPDLARRIVEEGHEIANHTDDHTFLRELSLASVCKQVKDAQDAIEEATGVRPLLFRPPGGSYSDAKVKAICEMGYRCVLWSKDTRDWTLPSVESVIKRATEDLKGGDILLFHDYNGENSPTPKALSEIIRRVEAAGFSLGTVSEVLEG